MDPPRRGQDLISTGEGVTVQSAEIAPALVTVACLHLAGSPSSPMLERGEPDTRTRPPVPAIIT
jgi:hypothetical protein